MIVPHQNAPADNSNPVEVVMPVGPIYTLIALPLRALTQMAFAVLVAKAVADPVTACCPESTEVVPARYIGHADASALPCVTVPIVPELVGGVNDAVPEIIVTVAEPPAVNADARTLRYATLEVLNCHRPVDVADVAPDPDGRG